MKTALIIVALMVVIVAVQAGGDGKRKCGKEKLEKWCSDGSDEKMKKIMEKITDESCKTKIPEAKEAACKIFKEDSEKSEEACEKLKVLKECFKGMKKDN